MTVPFSRSILYGTVCFVFALLATTLACSAMTPVNTRHRPERFEFDWPRHEALTPVVAGGFSDIDKIVRALALIETKQEAPAERVAWNPEPSRRSEKINSERDIPVGRGAPDPERRGSPAPGAASCR